MRIALLNDQIPPEGIGGAEAVVWRLAQGLKSAGHEVHVVTTSRRPAYEEQRGGIPTYHLHAAYPERFRAWLSLWNPQTARALRELLSRLKPDVVNAHNIHFYLSYHALKVAQDTGSATVFSAHDVMPFAYSKLRHFVKEGRGTSRLPDAYRLPNFYNLRHNRFRYNPARNVVIRHYLAHYADLRTVPSQALADAFAVNNLPAVEVAHNGIDASAWSEKDEALVAELRRRFGLEGKQVILIAGRLTADKGTLPLLRAMDSLKDAFPQMRLLALTARDIDEQIPAAVRHLRPLIHAGGWLQGDELRAAFHLADLVVVPSVIFDTFPTVNLEAMAAGKAVIATCFGGSVELVNDGETGYIVNPLDVEAFADRLRRLLDDEELRGAMGRRGQARIQQGFTVQAQVQTMMDVYQRARQRRRNRD